MKILLTIAARGGSKGIKNKNIRPLFGKPLIAYTIAVAKKWGKADRVIVSTDSEKIAEIAKCYGAEVPFMRPRELAEDDTPKLKVLHHALRYFESKGEFYDVLIDLDATAPLRLVSDLDNALKIFLSSDAKTLISVTRARKNPYFNMVEIDEMGFAKLSKIPDRPVYSRQKAPKVYELNASIYIFRVPDIYELDSAISEKTVIYEMPPERSVDIDSELDWLFVEFLVERGISKLPEVEESC